MRCSGLGVAAIAAFVALTTPMTADAQPGPREGVHSAHRVRGGFDRPVIFFENRAGNFRPEYFSSATAPRRGFGPRAVGPRIVNPRFGFDHDRRRRFGHRGFGDRYIVRNVYAGPYYPLRQSQFSYDVTPVSASPAPVTVMAQSAPPSPPLTIRVGAMCVTPDRTCRLENAGAVGTDCSCRGSEGTIRR
jgi:hypothetical protein